MLKDKIRNKQSGILFYGLTPPKQNNSPEKLLEISEKHLRRVDGLEIDGLILYDIQDESLRNDGERPFPFLPTLDPLVYSSQYLQAFHLPKVIYQCVGKHTRSSFSEWVQMSAGADFFSVFVGAASKRQNVDVSMEQAYELRKSLNPDMFLGGIAIPERHLLKGNEHLRMFEKIASGCSYFVTQAVYNLEASKNLLSDLCFYGKENGIETAPVIVTLSPCGSMKTLKFMEWLGISIPRWLENELRYSGDILQKSVESCLKIFEELYEFCGEKNIPLGCNVESVAIRREEIDASIELVKEINKIIKRRQQGK